MINFAEQEIKNEIMATDISVTICDPKISEREMLKDIAKCIEQFKAFERKFSRFKTGNELSAFNDAAGDVQVSVEFFEMLDLALKYSAFTDGVFDVTVLPLLLNEGYVVGKSEGFYIPQEKIASTHNLGAPNPPLKIIDSKARLIFKPKGVTIDLGGIGKGYIVKKVSDFLQHKYRNFIVDAGGDMYVYGSDLKNGYIYWAIGIEDPTNSENEVATLLISNKGVATSGVNRRHWQKGTSAKNHLIDIKSGKSVDNDLLTVTVISDSIVEADILAKSLLIMGLNDGIAFSESHHIASFFAGKSLQLVKSTEMEKYVWKS